MAKGPQQLSSGDVTTLTSAFPTSLGEDVQAAVEIMPSTDLKPTWTFSVSVDGQSVVIPYRLYNDEPTAEAGLSVTQQLVLDCLYTRHHDGRVRHRRLEHIMGSTQPWVIPFVVQLAGEYVLEIIATIQHELTELDRPGTSQHAAYGQFLARNSAFLAITGQRVASYWNCYFRSSYPERRSYPGHALLMSFQTAASTQPAG